MTNQILSDKDVRITKAVMDIVEGYSDGLVEELGK